MAVNGRRPPVFGRKMHIQELLDSLDVPASRARDLEDDDAQQRLWLRLLLAGIGLCRVLRGAGLAAAGSRPSRPYRSRGGARQQIDIDTFYDELDPYGQWVWHPRFGYVWLPENVSPIGAPIPSAAGPTPTSMAGTGIRYEPFAWAVYHYGRWGYDHDYGWFWVPGDTWAPAWVQWRYSDDYVGWAPIGPAPRRATPMACRSTTTRLSPNPGYSCSRAT